MGSKMGTKNLAGKVNDLYQASKDIIKNPRTLVAPLAFVAALSFSGRGYAYTKYTEILRDDFNREGQPLSTNINYELVSGDITTDIESGGKANISAPAPDVDLFKVSGSFTGALRYTTRFDIVPLNEGGFGMGFEDYNGGSGKFAYLEVTKSGLNNIEIIFGTDIGGEDIRIVFATSNLSLRLIKDTNGNITAEYSEDGNPFIQMNGSYNVPNEPTPDIYVGYDSVSPEQFKLDELVMEEITEAVPTYPADKSIDLAILLLIISAIKKLKTKEVCDI